MTTLYQKIKRFWKWFLLGTVVSAATVGAIVLPNPNEISIAKLTEKYAMATEIKAKYQMEGTSLKRNVVKNAELDKYKGEPKDEIKITLGDINSTDFTPDIEMKRWNEVSFKLKPRLSSVATKDKNLLFEGEKVRFKTPKMDFEMYEATTTDEYKYIWYLNEKPLTNKIEFDIETSGLDFFYQPELTPEEIAEGAFRPENVVGSYAVYHSTKGGMNDINGKEYKTGKAFHIYRPHIIDAEGKETWGILNIANEIYSVEIPQDFLDKAVYPIKSNDTFGYTTLGGSSIFPNSSEAWSVKVTSPVDISTATINSMSVGGSGTGSNKGVVWNSDATATLLSNSVTPIISVGAAKDWYSANYVTPPSFLDSTDYYLGFVNAGDCINYYDSVGTRRYDSINSYITPATMGTFYVGALSVSVYATYTPSGGGGTPSVDEGIIWFNSDE